MVGRSTASVAIGLLACALLLAGCGDDGGGGEAGGAAPSGEPCLQEGFTETSCQCAEGGLGRRTCTAELVYTPCSCRPPETGSRCAPGDPLECICPDQTRRRTVCLDEGTFDCPCTDAGTAGDDAG